MLRMKKWICLIAAILLLFAGLPANFSFADPSTILYLESDDVAPYQKNIILRARQMKEIEWICPENFVISSSDNISYSAGNTYHGIPHKFGTSDDYDYHYVPQELSFADFLDVVNGEYADPATLFNQNDGTNFYCDTSSFISYAWGINRKSSRKLKDDYTVDNSLLNNHAQLANANVDTALGWLCIGDAFVSTTDGATFLIADIRYDADNSVSRVVTWESSKTTLSRAKNVFVFDAANTSDECDFADLNRDYLVTHNTMPLGALIDRVIEGPFFHCRLKNATVTYTHDCTVPLDGDFCENCTPDLPMGTVSVMYGTNSAELDWAAVTGADLYEIYKNDIYLNSTTANGYTVQGTEFGGTSDVYKVRAVNTAPTAPLACVTTRADAQDLYYSYNQYSAWVTATAVGYPQITNAQLSNDQTGIQLTWSWNSTVSELPGMTYKIYRATANPLTHAAYTPVGTVPANGSTAYVWTDTTIQSPETAAMPYYYKINAQLNGAETEYSATMLHTHDGGYRLGDAEVNGSVAASDASLILRSVVGLSTLSEVGLLLADCDYSAQVDAQDASSINRYVVGVGTLPPHSTINPAANAASMALLQYRTVLVEQSIVDADTVRFTISCDAEDWDIVAAALDVQWDTDKLSLASATTPHSFSAVHTDAKDGTLRFAALKDYGAEVQGSTLLTIDFNILGEYSDPTDVLELSNLQLQFEDSECQIIPEQNYIITIEWD